MGEPSQVLLAFDTDRIKEYVFGLDTLREIRGASALLDSLNRDVMKALVGVEPVYANGGAALFVVDGNTAEEARQQVEREYREQTAGAASLTGVVGNQLPAGAPATTDIQQPFERLLWAMRLAKDRPPEALALTALPHLRPCDICGIYPASESDPHRPRQLICQACKRRGAGTAGLWSRRKMESGFDPWEKLQKSVGFTARRPNELGDIARLSRPEDYVGLVYADGDGMGRALQDLKTIDQFSSFAKGVDEAVFEATADAIREHLRPSDGWFPFDVPLLGGDDLVIVTRAQSALQVAVTLVDRFAHYTMRNTQRSLSMSVGVVLAHAKFPFRLLFDLAESALKFAKHERAKRKPKEGLINFLVVTSANHLDFKKYYHEHMCQKAEHTGGHDIIRTLRPYTAEGLGKLLQVARNLKDAPRNKLQALHDCVFQPYKQAVLEALTVVHRWRGNADQGRRWEQVQQLWSLVKGNGGADCLFPWRKDGEKWCTPLVDLAEVFDFVEGR
jgi:GGDEF domain-containing protein